MTGNEARATVDKALTALASLRKLANSSDVNAYLAKANLEIIDGAVSELLNVRKQIPDGVLPTGVATVQGKIKNALVRADVAIKTINAYGIKSDAALGISFAKEFADEALTFLPNLAEKTLARVTDIIDKVTQAPGNLLGGISGLLKYLPAIVLGVGVIVVVILVIKRK